MKKNIFMAVLFATTLTISACGNQNQAQTFEDTTTIVEAEETDDEPEITSGIKENDVDEFEENIPDIAPIEDNLDITQSYDLSQLTEDKLVIDQGGVYELTGVADGDLQVKINSESVESITLFLNNASWSNASECPLMIKKASNVAILTNNDSENSITDERDSDSDTDKKSVIFSKCDLEIGGAGLLILNANYKDGIRVSNLDKLPGNLTITSGEITINAENGHAIRSDGELNINGGNIIIQDSKEGVQGKYITINEGSLDITAADDGINATDPKAEKEDKDFKPEPDFEQPPDFEQKPDLGQKPDFENNPGFMKQEPSEDCSLTINGGTVNINALGDGLDSNAGIVITGGIINVSGSTNGDNAALDYASGCTMTGGTLILTGNQGMAGVLDDDSTVTMLAASYFTVMEDTEISLVDDNDTVIVSWIPRKSCTYIQIAAPEINPEATYYFDINGEKIEASLPDMKGLPPQIP